MRNIELVNTAVSWAFPKTGSAIAYWMRSTLVTYAAALVATYVVGSIGVIAFDSSPKTPDRDHLALLWFTSFVIAPLIENSIFIMVCRALSRYFRGPAIPALICGLFAAAIHCFAVAWNDMIGPGIVFASMAFTWLRRPDFSRSKRFVMLWLQHAAINVPMVLGTTFA